MLVTEAEPQNVQEGLLLNRARAGDPEAFGTLVGAHEPRLLRQAFALCGSQAVAEDLAQQALIEAWKSLHRFNDSCRLSTWLYSILLHLHHKWLRHNRSRPLSLASLPLHETGEAEARLREVPDGAPGPDAALEARESCEQWLACVGCLPEPHRRVVLLRFFEEASLEEIAVVLGCSLGTVKSRLHHGLKKLRQMRLSVNLSQTRREP